MKWVFLLLFVLIVLSLFSGLFFLFRDQGDSRRTLGSLAVRVGLSAFLLVLLAVSAFMGWIQPHSLNGEERRPEMMRSGALPGS
jgi:hypothetical protein